MNEHPPDCPGPIERDGGTQMAMPWGDARERVVEWCSTCGWVKNRSRKVPS